MTKIGGGFGKLSPNATAELNKKDNLIGIEILEASSFNRDSILESAQAKMLDIENPYNWRGCITQFLRLAVPFGLKNSRFIRRKYFLISPIVYCAS